MSDLSRAPSLSLLEHPRLATLSEGRTQTPGRRSCLGTATRCPVGLLESAPDAHTVPPAQTHLRRTAGTDSKPGRARTCAATPYAGCSTCANSGAVETRCGAIKPAAAKAFAALRWSGATDTAPLRRRPAAVDKTPAWEKRDAYTDRDPLARAYERELHHISSAAQCRTEVSEMTAEVGGHRPRQWDAQVVAGGKTAQVNSPLPRRHARAGSPTKHTGYLLPPARGSQSISG